MTAEVIQIRDYQNKRELDRVYCEALEREAMKVGAPVWPDATQANAFHAPEKDPA